MQRDASPEAVEFAAATAGRLIPQSPQPWQFLGRFAEVYGAPALAAKAYREAALRTPHRATYWFHLTRAYLELNDRAAARAAFEHGLEWYPNSPQRPELEAALAADKP